MKNKYFVALAACFILGGNALADDGLDLAHKHLCNSCHTMDKKLMGPSWMSISAMYQSQPDAEAHLIDKIRNGGTGTWGKNPMPPSPGVGEADIKILAHYILSLTKK